MPERLRTRRWPEGRAVVGRDEGFTVIELVVALLVFSLVMTGFTYGLQLALSVTRDNDLRIQASQLAARELEIVRNEFTSSEDPPNDAVNPHPLPGGTEGQPLNQDGTDFTVIRKVQWQPGESGESPCDGAETVGSEDVKYPSLAVNVRVRWHEGAKELTIANNTVLTPPKDTLSETLAFVAVNVVGADGRGKPDVPVTITGPDGSQTATTIVDAEDPNGEQSGGCAVFPIETDGTYTVTLNEPGFISFDGHQATSKIAVVEEGTLQVVPFSYDEEATLNLELVTAVGWQLPSPTQAVTLFNPGLPPMGTKTIAAGTTEVSNLWPYPDGYSGWAGTCAENDPANSGAARTTPVVVPPGGTGTLELPLTPVTVTVVDDAGNPLSGRTVVAMILDGSTVVCPTSGNLTLGTTDANGILKSSLPAGTWSLRLQTEPLCMYRTEEERCVMTPPLTGDLTEVPITLVPTG